MSFLESPMNAQRASLKSGATDLNYEEAESHTPARGYDIPITWGHHDSSTVLPYLTPQLVV